MSQKRVLHWSCKCQFIFLASIRIKEKQKKDVVRLVDVKQKVSGSKSFGK